MSLNKTQFQSLIERTLQDFDPALLSPQAVNLLLGTAAQESAFGTYIQQLGSGPALGIFQMEPATFAWLKKKFRWKYRELFFRKFEELEWDLRLAIIMARLRYRVDKEPLPSAIDIGDMAAYWKRVYNTFKGKGTMAEFVENYEKYVK